MHTFLLFFILNCHVEVDTGILLAFVSEFYSFIVWDVMLQMGEVDPPTKLLTSNQSKNERNSRHQLLYDRSFAMISYVVGTTVEHSPQHSGQIHGTPGPADLQTEHLEKVCWIETRRQIKQAEHLNGFPTIPQCQIVLSIGVATSSIGVSVITHSVWICFGGPQV